MNGGGSPCLGRHLTQAKSAPSQCSTRPQQGPDKETSGRVEATSRPYCSAAVCAVVGPRVLTRWESDAERAGTRHRLQNLLGDAREDCTFLGLVPDLLNENPRAAARAMAEDASVSEPMNPALLSRWPVGFFPPRGWSTSHITCCWLRSQSSVQGVTPQLVSLPQFLPSLVSFLSPQFKWNRHGPISDIKPCMEWFLHYLEDRHCWLPIHQPFLSYFALIEPRFFQILRENCAHGQ